MSKRKKEREEPEPEFRIGIEQALSEIRSVVHGLKEGAKGLVHELPKPFREGTIPRPIRELLEKRETILLRESLLKRLRKRSE